MQMVTKHMKRCSISLSQASHYSFTTWESVDKWKRSKVFLNQEPQKIANASYLNKPQTHQSRAPYLIILGSRDDWQFSCQHPMTVHSPQSFSPLCTAPPPPPFPATVNSHNCDGQRPLLESSHGFFPFHQNQ